MTLEPLLRAPPAVQLHVATVLPAFVIGSWSLFLSAKGSPAHRWGGRLFVSLMAVTALSTLFVPAAVGPTLALGPLRFGLIHLFIPVTVHGLWRGLGAIRRGDVALHERAMRRLYLLALVLAGLFTLAPGRTLYRVFAG
ncbi:MAG: DUF2306 domain-containing protein [Steroidobacteraceae bacterium]|jgi:uncharacterized membrane protein|nr:DUF2306 domain-containing protein [Steroidobacteraceae bacterium]